MAHGSIAPCNSTKLSKKLGKSMDKIEKPFPVVAVPGGGIDEFVGAGGGGGAGKNNKKRNSTEVDGPNNDRHVNKRSTSTASQYHHNAQSSSSSSSSSPSSCGSSPSLPVLCKNGNKLFQPSRRNKEHAFAESTWEHTMKMAKYLLKPSADCICPKCKRIDNDFNTALSIISEDSDDMMDGPVDELALFFNPIAPTIDDVLSRNSNFRQLTEDYDAFVKVQDIAYTRLGVRGGKQFPSSQHKARKLMFQGGFNVRPGQTISTIGQHRFVSWQRFERAKSKIWHDLNEATSNQLIQLARDSCIDSDTEIELIRLFTAINRGGRQPNHPEHDFVVEETYYQSPETKVVVGKYKTLRAKLNAKEAMAEKEEGKIKEELQTLNREYQYSMAYDIFVSLMRSGVDKETESGVALLRYWKYRIATKYYRGVKRAGEILEKLERSKYSHVLTKDLAGELAGLSISKGERPPAPFIIGPPALATRGTKVGLKRPTRNNNLPSLR